jgi:hypothetical protein
MRRTLLAAVVAVGLVVVMAPEEEDLPGVVEAVGT